ncbi:FMN2, partial [Symbiodinium pilosum]
KAEGAAPAEEAKAEGAAEEAAPKAGKGPKGPKGPAKGPGKGPPAPGGGKGPAAPAGKGPGGPPGAKGGAKGGKGGKPGKGVSLETKPAVKPSQQMKPLWWNKMLFGAQLQKGETIWDEVKDDMDKLPIGELTLRFSKAAIAQKEKPKKEEGLLDIFSHKKMAQQGEKKKEEVTLIRIITDPQIVVGKEASLRKLPEPSEVAKALDELNDKILDLEMLQVVKDNACPNPAQLKELGEARQKNPNVPLALPESFMWVIGNMPAYQQRIDVWSFAQSYKEQHASYDVALRDFLSLAFFGA